jgi:uncharacterized protein with PQ loop repeat
MPPTLPMTTARGARTNALLNRLIPGLSVFTMVMTIPQVWTIWAGHRASGVSLPSWAAYLASAVVWFFYGLHRRDRNIYLPCIGWIILDGAVLIGALAYG